ncbi:MAG: SH3 domain-containing protein [Lachnospiraceae bacterium]|nr:SH3 domain-containing protein [Lachnospiraceae bacterium]
MSFKQINLDNPEEAKEYKKEKDHKRFMRENKNLEEKDVTPAYNNTESIASFEKEIGTNMLAKVVKVDKLRVRKYPEGEIIRMLNKGDEVRIISDFDDIWYNIELPDKTRGFAMKTYLMAFEEAPELDDKSRRCKTNV